MARQGVGYTCTMQRFKGIVAILMLVLVMPLARASAVMSRGAKVQPDCCQHKADMCCEGSSELCCATQAPVDSSLYPAQNVSPMVLPAASVSVVYTNNIDSLNACCSALRSPAQHSPPGLIIAATIVLRI
jgi:hypothetical protein